LTCLLEKKGGVAGNIAILFFLDTFSLIPESNTARASKFLPQVIKTEAEDIIGDVI